MPNGKLHVVYYNEMKLFNTAEMVPNHNVTRPRVRGSSRTYRGLPVILKPLTHLFVNADYRNCAVLNACMSLEAVASSEAEVMYYMLSMPSPRLGAQLPSSWLCSLHILCICSY